MKSMNIEISKIGIIHSPFKELGNMPIQPVGAQDAEGEVVLEERFTAGLKDLDGFSHIYLIYHFHKATRMELEVVPYMDSEKRGVFATRSPLRSAHIGMSIVELLAVEGNRLKVRGIDVLDGTPLIDVKPYILQFDYREGATSGWMKSAQEEVDRKRSDNRFV
jgi:tRNA-Thr(GGU) m(6)t(6)A37 methyltransferase TsaA